MFEIHCSTQANIPFSHEIIQEKKKRKIEKRKKGKEIREKKRRERKGKEKRTKWKRKRMKKQNWNKIWKQIWHTNHFVCNASKNNGSYSHITCCRIILSTNAIAKGKESNWHMPKLDTLWNGQCIWHTLEWTMNLWLSKTNTVSMEDLKIQPKGSDSWQPWIHMVGWFSSCMDVGKCRKFIHKNFILPVMEHTETMVQWCWETTELLNKLTNGFFHISKQMIGVKAAIHSGCLESQSGKSSQMQWQHRNTWKWQTPLSRLRIALEQQWKFEIWVQTTKNSNVSTQTVHTPNAVSRPFFWWLWKVS